MEVTAAGKSPPRKRGEARIGTRLLRLLEWRGWSLAQLASASGVSVSQLSLLTRGLISHPRADTLRAICSALEVTEASLLDPPPERVRRQADLRAAEGVTSVPLVTLGPQGALTETGQRIAIARSQLDGRRRLCAAEVEGGGMAPHVMIGDRVLFDPDAETEHQQLALVTYHEVTRVAWRVDRDLRAQYWINENKWLDGEGVHEAGPVVYILRPPPAYPAP